MKVSNIDTISAYIDRLITERIKWYFFVKNQEHDKANHQKLIILAIRKKISDLLNEYIDYTVDTLQERRTFHLMNDIEKLTIFDLEIGESDRERLRLLDLAQNNRGDVFNADYTDEFVEQELRLRTANESRSKTKNDIDELLGEIFI